MERQELIRQAAGAAAAPAAPGAEAAEVVHKATPRAGQHRRGYRASGGRAKRRPLFYAHCASAQQTLLHMTIAKGISIFFYSQSIPHHCLLINQIHTFLTKLINFAILITCLMPLFGLYNLLFCLGYYQVEFLCLLLLTRIFVFGKSFCMLLFLLHGFYGSDLYSFYNWMIFLYLFVIDNCPLAIFF
jgi:hypothetical protein